MSRTATTNAHRPDFDAVVQAIADYVLDYNVTQSCAAMETARYCFMDTLGCALYALTFPACTRLLGPVVPGAVLYGGARVPGTSHELEPVRAAWNFGTMLRWLDFNDTWLAAEWGHPSDNLGAILALADYQSRTALASGGRSLLMMDVLQAMIKAHEIQGVIALENAFNRVGLDHVLLVRIASAAVAAMMLGCKRDAVLSAVSNAWIDGSALRTYRQAPNTGTRKSWAAGDASARGLFLALLASRGEMGYPSALSAPVWGFQDVSFRGKPLEMKQAYGTYVMENILFKLDFPAEFHAQTAVEAAIKLHSRVVNRLDDIGKILIETQESGNRIINKTGSLANPADRDHCLQYMVAVALIKGRLTATDYEAATASDPRIDSLRDTMEVVLSDRFTRDYLDSEKRAVGNAVQVFFKDGSATDRVAIDYPVGHRRRREEGIPLLRQKFARHLRGCVGQVNADRLLALCAEQDCFEQTAVDEVMSLLFRE